MKLFQSSILCLIALVARILAVPLEAVAKINFERGLLDESNAIALSPAAHLPPSTFTTESRDDAPVSDDTSSDHFSSILKYTSP